MTGRASDAATRLRNAWVYRGWRYVVYQRGKRDWDIECDPPGDLMAPCYMGGNPWRAWTASRAERKFKRFVDDDIARRAERDRLHRVLYGSPTNLFPPTEEELRAV